MKQILVLFLILFSTSKLISQNKFNFKEEKLSEQTKIVNGLAELMICKKDTIKDFKFYKKESIEFVNELRNFEKEIENSNFEIDYYIDYYISDNKNKVYSVHFYSREKSEQFSKIYFLFKFNDSLNKLDNKIEKYQLDGKDIIDKMKEDWIEEMGDDIPIPPLPPYSKN